MSNLAINDAGDVLAFDGQQWAPAPMAANDAGERVVFDGQAWQPLGKLVGKAKGSKAQNVSDAAANAVGQGVLQGFGDEAVAGVRAYLPNFSNWMMSGPALQRDASIGGDPNAKPQTVSTAPTLAGRYEEELARQRAQTDADAAAHPVTTTVGRIAGSVAGTLPLLAVPGGQAILGGGAATLPGAMMRGAASGVALGGLQGFGEGEGGLSNRLGSAGMGAALGGVVGGVAPLVGTAAKYAYDKVAPPLLNAVANTAERFVPRTPAQSLSAAADGGNIPRQSLATAIADTTRNAANTMQDDAALRRLALEIQRSGGTQRATEQLGTLGEGAMLLDTSRGAERLANLGFVLPGDAADKYTAALRARNAGTGERFVTAMGPEANRPTLEQAGRYLEPYISQTGRELYDPALRGSARLRVSGEMQRLMQVPAIRDAISQVQADAAQNGAQITAAEAAHLVKRTLNNQADAAFQSGRAVNKAQIGQLADQWEQALWRANPEIGAADQAYAQTASLPEWLKRGSDFMKQGTSETAQGVSPTALAADLPGATPGQREVLRVGSSDVMRTAAESGPESTRRLAKAITDNNILRQKMTEIYDPAFVESVTRRSAAERKFAESTRKVMGGSDTAQRLAAIADDLAVPVPSGGASTPASLIQALLKGYNKIREPNEAIRSRLADLLANSDRLTNEETLRAVEQIIAQQRLARPVRAGVAAAAGSAAPGDR